MAGFRYELVRVEDTEPTFVSHCVQQEDEDSLRHWVSRSRSRDGERRDLEEVHNVAEGMVALAVMASVEELGNFTTLSDFEHDPYVSLKLDELVKLWTEARDAWIEYTDHLQASEVCQREHGSRSFPYAHGYQFRDHVIRAENEVAD